MAQGATSSVAVGPPVLLQAMSQRADASQCGGVVVEFETDDIRDARAKKSRSVTGELNFKSNRNLRSVFAMYTYSITFSCISPQGSALIYLKGPKFLIYVSGALSMWVRIFSFGNRIPGERQDIDS